MKHIAKEIVDRILDDLTDRRGLRHEWDLIDEDIKNEIRTSWFDIINEVLNERS